MRAAAHRFAVRVEDERRDVGEPVRSHRLCEPPLQPLDREAGGKLTDEASGVGKAGLDRNTPAGAGILAVGRLGEQSVEEASTMFECGLGFEKR